MVIEGEKGSAAFVKETDPGASIGLAGEQIHHGIGLRVSDGLAVEVVAVIVIVLLVLLHVVIELVLIVVVVSHEIIVVVVVVIDVLAPAATLAAPLNVFVLLRLVRKRGEASVEVIAAKASKLVLLAPPDETKA